MKEADLLALGSYTKAFCEVTVTQAHGIPFPLALGWPVRETVPYSERQQPSDSYSTLSNSCEWARATVR
jgi:hypothetical protein